MAEIRDISDAFSWPVSRLAELFDMHRQTLSKRIKQHGLAPAGSFRGNPTYNIAQVARIIYAPIDDDEDEAPLNLDRNPDARKAWYQSENERIKFETSVQHLIPDHVYAREMSFMAKSVASVLDSVPDLLERKAGIDPSALDAVEKAIDSVRDQLYQKVFEGDPEQGGDE